MQGQRGLAASGVFYAVYHVRIKHHNHGNPRWYEYCCSLSRHTVVDLSNAVATLIAVETGTEL